MSEPIISVQGLSKKFIISHEGSERYTALRDVVADRAKKIIRRSSEQSQATREEFWALKDISFDINAGDRVGIIGRNGAGKSTLLKVLSRITEPTAGRIKIRGRVASLLEVGTGFHPELTGRENIFLNGAILGMSRQEIRRKFDEIVEFAEVEKFLDTPVKRYSSGMYVRLAFAVAAHLEPEILIVDEVLAVGDVQFQKKCLGKMEDVSKNEGRTVLFVSHNMGVIAQFCSTAILLNKGEIERTGSTTDIVNAYINFNSAGSNSSIYEAKSGDRTKQNYFKTIALVNTSNEPCSDFSFDEPVKLNFELSISNKISNLQVGIGIQDKLQNRVTTLIKPLDYFSDLTNLKYSGSVQLPQSVLAPGTYSFVFALWSKGVVVCDQVENILNFQIHDNGTEMAIYSEYDYGSVILNAIWLNDKKGD